MTRWMLITSFFINMPHLWIMSKSLSILTLVAGQNCSLFWLHYLQRIPYQILVHPEGTVTVPCHYQCTYMLSIAAVSTNLFHKHSSLIGSHWYLLYTLHQEASGQLSNCNNIFHFKGAVFGPYFNCHLEGMNTVLQNCYIEA